MPRGRRRKPFKLKLKKTTVYTFSSVALFALSGIIILSFSRQGPFLTKIFILLNHYLGWGIIFLPFLLIVAGLMLSRLQWRISRPNVFVGVLLLMVSLISLTRSGFIGFEIWQNLAFLITAIGAFLVLFGFVFIGFVVTFNTSLEEMFIFFGKSFSAIRKITSRSQFTARKLPFEVREEKRKAFKEAHPMGEPTKLAPSLDEAALSKTMATNLSLEGQVWEFPPTTILDESLSGKADRGDIKKNAEIIEKTLESFGISARVVEVNLGPAVTQYALEIALGTKLSKVTALSTDLALALAAPTGQIRIEAPIPGRSLVGVEVPNRSLEFVSLKRMLTSEQMKRSKSKLAVALGLNVSGEPVIADIARMPHVLIAGATGSGKTCGKKTLVVTEKGMLTFEELSPLPLDKEKELELKVATRDGIEKTSKVYNNGICDFYKITTEEGFSIEITPEHPLWMMKKSGQMDWENGENIKIGDYLAIARGNQLFGNKTDLSDFALKKDPRVPSIKIPKKMTVDLAQFLGCLVADGGLSIHNRVVYTQMDKTLLDLYENLLKKLFGVKKIPQVKSGNKGSKARDIVVRNKYLKDFLSYLGLGEVKSIEKEVPRSIRQAPKEIVVAFLKSLMEHDAHIGANTLELTVASQKLAQQAQLLLLNLGIISSLKIKKVKRYSQNQYFRLSIYGEEFRKYITEIGFIRPQRYLITKKHFALNHNSNKNLVPHLISLFQFLKKEYRFRFARLTNKGWQYLKDVAVPKYALSSLKSYNTGIRLPSYQALNQIIEFYEPLSDTQSYQDLKKITRTNFYWSKVAKIERTKGEGYDFEVPGSNSFVGNGFINHNSVCIQTIISTILFRASPAEVKLILIDPKRVELTQYNGIPHLYSPVIVEPDKVLSALRWTIQEMDRRYKLFAENGVRNIDGYNELSGFAALPYMVIIVDELADIIMFAPTDVEDAICRIAQMARATGIHLIVSTQRPSVDVITGLIKANISCRIAFNVSSQVDSRVIIDTPGAEKLLGRGDMLFIPPDQAKPTRIQGTFVSDGEIKRLIDFIRKAGVAPVYTEEVTKMPVKTRLGKAEVEEKDELFDDAIRIVCNFDRASASLFQRRLKIGYARAARILDQLEAVNIIGPAEGSKSREVFSQNAQDYLASRMAS